MQARVPPSIGDPLALLKISVRESRVTEFCRGSRCTGQGQRHGFCFCCCLPVPAPTIHPRSCNQTQNSHPLRLLLCCCLSRKAPTALLPASRPVLVAGLPAAPISQAKVPSP